MAEERKGLLLAALQEARIAWPDDNFLSTSYLSSGCPSLALVLENIRIQSELRLSPNQTERHADLLIYLKSQNLEVRFDSELCINFIFHGKGSLPKIAERMGEAKHLHENCDFQKGYEAALKEMNPRMSKQARLALIRRHVKKYPKPDA